jgi:hypothetical protein
MKKLLNEFGFPIRDFKSESPKIIYLKKVFYKPKFFWRKAFFSIDLNDFNLIPRWYLNKDIAEFTLNLILKFKIFIFPKFLLKYYFILCFFFQKKNIINLKYKNVILFGPYVNNHTHKIIDFLLRLVFLNKFEFNKIFIPDELKSFVTATKLDIYLKKFKIIYFKSYENYIFYNASYLSHIDSRNFNLVYKKSTQQYKKFIHDFSYKKNNKYKYILISRNHSKRKLINEEHLYNALKTFGFLRINFEDYSKEKQIEISRNAEIMIGYHGAGLSNAFFMNKRNFIIELVNSHYNHPFYGIFTKVLDLNYKKFICKKSYKNLNGLCDVEQVIRYIRKIFMDNNFK